MDPAFDAADHYWHVQETGQHYASARASFVSADDAGMAAHLAAGRIVTRIATGAELADVLERLYPPGIGPALRQPRPADVYAERARRLATGFDFDFGDARGVHRIGTTAADLQGWDEVSKLAGALIETGTPEEVINIDTDTGLVSVTAAEWRAVELAAGAFRQPIYQASFALTTTDPIPEDFADDRHWP